jgi:hypothetical protein
MPLRRREPADAYGCFRPAVLPRLKNFLRLR